MKITAVTLTLFAGRISRSPPAGPFRPRGARSTTSSRDIRSTATASPTPLRPGYEIDFDLIERQKIAA